MLHNIHPGISKPGDHWVGFYRDPLWVLALPRSPRSSFLGGRCLFVCLFVTWLVLAPVDAPQLGPLAFVCGCWGPGAPSRLFLLSCLFLSWFLFVVSGVLPSHGGSALPSDRLGPRKVWLAVTPLAGAGLRAAGSTSPGSCLLPRKPGVPGKRFLRSQRLLSRESAFLPVKGKKKQQAPVSCCLLLQAVSPGMICSWVSLQPRGCGLQKAVAARLGGWAHRGGWGEEGFRETLGVPQFLCPWLCALLSSPWFELLIASHYVVL